jgi:hypothetical protein
MRKSVELLVTVLVEADDDDRQDFGRRAISAVRDALKVGRARHPDLAMTVERIVEVKEGEPS